MGRKTTFNQQIADTIVERLEQGIPLEEICRAEGMPASRTVNDWKEVNPEFAAQLAQARAAGFDVIAADCLKIADDRTNDTVETPNGPKFNGEWAQRSKIRIETRLKLLAVWARSKYGEHVAVQVEDSRPGLSRADALTALQAGSISAEEVLGKWVKPVRALAEEVKTAETPQPSTDQDLVDID